MYTRRHYPVRLFERLLLLRPVAHPPLLNGVEVKGSRPVYRMDQWGFTAPIANTVLARLGTGMDVLQQLPFVKSENEGISVMGQRGQTLVYINKRKMQDWSEVSQLASSEVKSVRIVTNPGPEYGAEVGTVIIINTLRPTGEGLGGYVMAEGQQWRGRGAVSQSRLGQPVSIHQKSR